MMHKQTALLIGVRTLGEGAVRALAAAGYDRLVTTNRTQDTAEKQAEKLREIIAADGATTEIIPLALDVSKYESVSDNPEQSSIQDFAARLEKIVPEEEGIDAVLVLAGGNRPHAVFNKQDGPKHAPPSSKLPLEDRRALAAPFKERTGDSIRELFDINVLGPEMVIRALMPRLIVQERPPVVITIGSVADQLSGVDDYAASKAALRLLTGRTARNLADFRIAAGLQPGRAVCLIWGFTESEQSKRLLRDEDDNPTFRGTRIIDGTPLRRLGTIEEFGACVRFILENGYINIELRADGGFGSALVV